MVHICKTGVLNFLEYVVNHGMELRFGLILYLVQNRLEEVHRFLYVVLSLEKPGGTCS
jgi:hypothetical protein